MVVEEKFTVKAPIQKVWDSLTDAQMMASCVPGCEKVEVVDERTYVAVVEAKVGAISARFKFTTTVVEWDPPTHLKALGSGQDLKGGGTFSQESIVDLKDLSDGEVEVSYRSSVSVVGRLATFGDRIMRAKAKELGDEFAQSLNRKIVADKVQ